MYSNGDRYEGDFIDGQMGGLGALTEFDGRRFEGEWVADRRCGLGAQWDQAGKIVACGRWTKDKMVEQRSVPLSKISVGKCLSASGEQQGVTTEIGWRRCSSKCSNGIRRSPT